MRFLFGAIFFVAFFSWKIINAADVLSESSATKARSIRVDYERDCFLKDGEPFRYVSGSFHYFRALPSTWRHRLRTMRAAGLNAVSTYVEWSLHNSREGVYDWNEIADLEQFIRIAAEEDLFVILRPGPYICAERDLGGFPSWLLTKYPDLELRTADTRYLTLIRQWYRVLMPKIQPLLYGNGGPIILVQIENEYGSFRACDHEYMKWLKEETESYVSDKAVLYTTDGPYGVSCGKTDGALATIDFGAEKKENVDKFWGSLRRYEPNGPLVNSEFYPGWLTHWQEQMSRVETEPVLDTLRYMLQQNASVNFYMFFGGTNFGFTAGANSDGSSYAADLTSYDYDAPMDETGDPTPKYMAIRDVIKDFLPLPNVPVPPRQVKTKYAEIELQPIGSLLSQRAKNTIARGPVRSQRPLRFEEMGQSYGFVLYEVDLPKLKKDPNLLTVNDLRDRAQVIVDNNFIGSLSRENKIASLPLDADVGQRLQLLVENQGRINYGIPNDMKGIIQNVTVNGQLLSNWTMYGFPFDNYTLVQLFVRNRLESRQEVDANEWSRGPNIFHGTFNIAEGDLFDSFIDPTGWSKGIIFVNGFNLGRYWPLVGPQITLYLPKELLKVGENSITLIELQRAARDRILRFTDEPNLDAV